MAWFRKAQYRMLPTPSVESRVPDGLCAKCPRCGVIHLTRDYHENLRVCSKCQHHDKLTVQERMKQTLDPKTFVETNADLAPADPLHFVDIIPYSERILKYQRQTGMKDAVVTGHGEIKGVEVSLAFMNFAFVAASMGSVVGEKITRAFEYSLEHRIPTVVFCTSGGARMQEGILSLMQMAKTSALVGCLKDAKLPYINVLTDPTTAGVMASFASLGDLTIAEPSALIGFAGPRVIEQTIRQVLPKGFQRSEFVQDHGFVDMIVPRKKMRDTLGSVLAMLTHRAPVEVVSEQG
ncbi:acetyl-CoA carboxylase carboxyltransferase subunit beta [bacterium]|nr:acetyl-CoA carboxylase carboxyltransferase subunit beta [bacterium]